MPHPASRLCDFRMGFPKRRHRINAGSESGQRKSAMMIDFFGSVAMGECWLAENGFIPPCAIRYSSGHFEDQYPMRKLLLLSVWFFFLPAFAAEKESAMQ